MALGLYELINNINKQIKGICCKIENLDSGGGGGTNIYNSDGTLTGNRTLDANYSDLNFIQLQTLKFSNNPLDYGYFQDNSTIKLGDYANNYWNGLYLEIDNNNGIIKTGNQNNDIGLKLDFANQLYDLGTNSNFVRITETTNAIDIQGLVVPIGDVFSLGNQTIFAVDDTNQLIKTSNQGNDIGLLLDFANQQYQIGNLNSPGYIWVDNINGNIELESTSEIIGKTGNLRFIQINTISQKKFFTNYQGNDTGLKLDFANNVYDLGDFNNNYLNIKLDDSLGTRTIFINTNGIVNIGDTINGYNGTKLIVDDSQQLIHTKYLTNDIGLKIDFANSIYQFGQLTGGNATQLIINDAGEFAYFDNNNDGGNGLFLDYATKRFYFGEFAGGGNNTHIKIDDAAAYPVEIFGTNISANTAGAASGQFLKIKVNNVDYKIALLNP